MYSSGWSAQKRLAISMTSAIAERGGYTFATSCGHTASFQHTGFHTATSRAAHR